MYYGARFYHPVVGRFLSVDPLYGDPTSMDGDGLATFLSQPQKLGIYAYVLNNPLRYVDPSGLEESDTWQYEEPIDSPPSFRRLFTGDFLYDSTLTAHPAQWKRNAEDDPFNDPDQTKISAGRRDSEIMAKGWTKANLRFTVRDKKGKPLANRHVQVVVWKNKKKRGGYYRTTAVTDSKGRATIEGAWVHKSGKIRVDAAFKSSGKYGGTVVSGEGKYSRKKVHGRLDFRVNVEKNPAKSGRGAAKIVQRKPKNK